MHIGSSESVFNDVEHIDGFFLRHHAVKLGQEVELEFYKGPGPLQSLHDFVDAALAVVRGQMTMEAHQDIDGFIKLFLTDTEAEKLKSELLLDFKCQLEVKLRSFLVRQHVVDQVATSPQD